LDVSIAFARIWGGFFFIFGLLFIVAKFLGRPIERTDDENFSVSTGYISFMFGLVTVALHNIWALDWRLVITLLGWVTLIKGIMKIAFPEFIHQQAQRLRKKQEFSALALFVAGAWLLWKGIF